MKHVLAARWGTAFLDAPEQQTDKEWLQDAIRHLNSPNSSLRAWAIGVLDGMPSVPSSVLPELVAAFHETDSTVHHTLATALARIGPDAEPAIPTLLRILTTKPQWIIHPETTPDMPAQGAMEALAAIGEVAVPPLREAMRDRDVQTRLVVTWAVGKVAQSCPAAVPVLMEALRDKERWIAAQAAHALGECGSAATDAVSLLGDVVTDRDVFVRAEATHALCKIHGAYQGNYSTVVQELSNALGDETELVRAKAAHTLGHLGKEARGVVPALINALQTDDEPLLEATTALAEIAKEEPSIIPTLVHLVATRDDALSTEIAGALIAMGPAAKSVVPHLIAKMNQDSAMRQYAILGFATLEADPKEVVPLLTEIVLKSVDSPDAVQDLHRARAVDSLGVLAPRWKEAIVPVLVRAAYDPVDSVRNAAAVALGKLALA